MGMWGPFRGLIVTVTHLLSMPRGGGGGRVEGITHIMLTNPMIPLKGSLPWNPILPSKGTLLLVYYWLT